MAGNPLQLAARQAAISNGVPPDLFERQIHAESGFNPQAVSPVGAKGLGQLMPGTARGLGVTDPFNPIQNLNASAKYLRMQYNKFGRWDLALAAYNAGPGAVAKYGGVPPFAETQHYVSSIMGGQNPGVSAPPSQGLAAKGLPALGDGIPGAPLTGQQAGAQMLQASQPSSLEVNLMQALGSDSTSGKIAQMQQDSPIQLPDFSTPPAGGSSASAPSSPMIPVSGIHSLLNGSASMVTGATQSPQYPNLRFSPHADWQHVNPRLLAVVNAEAKKRGVVADMISGYRSNVYSQGHGGFSGDPHTKGLAGDFYINGHPIGEVVTPDEWAKLGVRSGNAPGFYKGKSDPEHLDLVGIPIKGRK